MSASSKPSTKEGADAWFARRRRASASCGIGRRPDGLGEGRTTFSMSGSNSGSTHAFVLEQRPDLKWPADVYLEGSDQHRGWFHSSLLESLRHAGQGALRHRHHPWLHHGRGRPQDVEVARQPGLPAGRHQAVGRRHPAPLGGLDRLCRRPAHRPGDPEDAMSKPIASCATRLRYILGALDGLKDIERIAHARHAGARTLSSCTSSHELHANSRAGLSRV